MKTRCRCNCFQRIRQLNRNLRTLYFPASQFFLDLHRLETDLQNLSAWSYFRWAQARPSGPFPVATFPVISSFCRSTATTSSLALTAI